ncbi:MAG: transporter substrate-binding domain-containing protein, partial [Pantoea sp.]|nr:transporter substrate-binding domain-containing protein [Pantoea sp.]
MLFGTVFSKTFSTLLALCALSFSTLAASDDNPYGLIEPGQLRVASVGDSRPYTFTDASGQFTGFDVEFFKNVAHRMGIDKVDFVGQDFSAIMPAVDIFKEF